MKKIEQLRSLINEGVFNALTRDLRAELAAAFPITTEVIGSVVSDFQSAVGKLLKSKNSKAYITYTTGQGAQGIPTANKLQQLKFQPLDTAKASQIEALARKFLGSVNVVRTRAMQGTMARIGGQKRVTGPVDKATQELTNFILLLEKIDQHIHITIQEKQNPSENITEYRISVSYLSV